MGAYLYFDLAPITRVFHFMGKPDKRRATSCEERGAVDLAALVDPRRGRNRGYTFCWGHGGDNVDFTDMDMVAMEDLR